MLKTLRVTLSKPARQADVWFIALCVGAYAASGSFFGFLCTVLAAALLLVEVMWGFNIEESNG